MTDESKQSFDASDAFQRVADQLRRDVGDIASKMIETADYRSLDGHGQLGSMLAGLMTGVLGVMFAHVRDESRDAMVQAVIDYVPLAREAAEDIIEEGISVN